MPVVHVKERMRECVRQKMQRAILEMELFLSGKKKKKSEIKSSYQASWRL